MESWINVNVLFWVAVLVGLGFLGWRFIKKDDESTEVNEVFYDHVPGQSSETASLNTETPEFVAVAAPAVVAIEPPVAVVTEPKVAKKPRKTKAEKSAAAVEPKAKEPKTAKKSRVTK